MNTRVIAIVMLHIAGFALGIMGIVFLFEAGSAHSAYFHDTDEFIAGAQRSPQNGEGKK